MSKSKEPNNSMYQRVTVKDILVILVGLIALVALIFVVMEANRRSKQQEEQLTEISNQNEQLDSAYSLDDISKYLVINEINQEGWVEFYNAGKRNMDLTGYRVQFCDREITLGKEFGELKAKKIMAVSMEGTLPIGELFTIEVYNPEGKQVMVLTIPELERGRSYGCLTNGSIERGIISASVSEDNVNESVTFKELIHFSVPAGFYEEPFQLELASSDANANIYYTLDGSEPTMDSDCYENPIQIVNQSGSDVVYANLGANSEFAPKSINKCTVVRAAAFDKGGTKLGEANQSYFIGVKNATDYLNIPILSVTVNPEDLFDYYSGVYVPGRSAEDAIARGDKNVAANYLNGWKKEAYLEYFEPGKSLTYSGSAQISVVLDSSVAKNQKSLRFELDNRDVSQYSTLSTYISENENAVLMTTYPQDNSYKIREYIVSQLAEDAGVLTKQFQPCALFIDGEYWGLYMMPMEYGADYIEAMTDIPSEEILLWSEKLETEDGAALEEWENLQKLLNDADLSVSENYEQVAELIDIPNYVDYLCFNLYLANGSYGNNGVTAWRTISTDGSGYRDGKWRFYCTDLADVLWNGMSGKKNTPSIDSFLLTGVTDDAIFKALIVNEEFRTLLSKSMNRLSDNVFTEEKINEVLTQTTDLLRKPVLSSHKRFVANSDDSFFTNEMTKISNFFINRKDYILLYTDEVVTGKVDLYPASDIE